MDLTKFFHAQERRKAQKYLLKGNLAEPYAAYLQCVLVVDKNTSIQELDFVVLDTETTGLDYRQDKILSIGAFRIKGSSILLDEAFDKQIARFYTGKAGAVQTHQILKHELSEGEDEYQTLLAFLEYVKGSIIVAHHADFDVEVLGRLCKTHFGFPIFNLYLDTLLLAKRLERGIEQFSQISKGEYTIDALCTRYDIQNTGRHNALGDARATAELFLILLHRLKKRGVTKLNQLL
ncbi:MAG: 3'-5' exonuclease [Bacteroidota bacterium]